MCQRVLIAMAFASKPRLVIADEPTTALDVTIQARIVRLIAEMQERDGTAVVFITHDLRLAAQICDDILVLYAGRPAEYGPARAVLAAPGASLYALPAAREPADERRAARACIAARAHAGLARLQGHQRLRLRAALSQCRARTARAAPPPFVEIAPGAHGRLHPHRRHGARSRRRRLPPTRGPPPARRCSQSQALCKDFTGRQRMFNRVDTSRLCAMSASRSRQNEFLGVVGESGSGKTTLGAPAGRARAAVARAASHSPATRSCTISTSARSAARRADDLPGSAIGAQSAPPRRRHRHAVARSGRHRQPRGAARHAPRSCSAEIGLPPETARALSLAALRRPAPARQYRARALRGAEDPDRRRDRVRARRFGAGAAA